MKRKQQAFAPLKKGTIRVIIKREDGKQEVYEAKFDTPEGDDILLTIYRNQGE